MNRTSPLRLALLANAAFSATFAVIMLVEPVSVGRLLGVEVSLLYRLIGFGLLIFAADLIHQATRTRVASWRALYASVADFLWVLATIVVVASFPAAFTTPGIIILLAVAAAVLVFGAWQLWAIVRLHEVDGSGMLRHCVAVRVETPAAAMWGVIRRLGEISDYMPMLKSSEVLDGGEPGEGAIRRCADHAGKSWSEECTVFDETKRMLVVRFLSDEPGFPFPAKRMMGGWEVRSSADGGSEVMVWWELEPKPKLMAPVMLPMLAFQVDRDFPPVIERMARGATGSAGDESGDVRPVARLIPRLC